MHPHLQRPDAHRPAAAAFTLMELLTVCAILGVLFGIGIGFLGRGSGTAEAIAAIGSQLRAASLHARSSALPTAVLIAPGRDGGNATVRTRGLLPVAVFGFEEGERQLDSVLEPVVGGTEVLHGRFGRARAPLAGDKHPLLDVGLPPSAADLRDGFALRFDLLLHARHGGVLVQLARALEVAIDDEARPRARLVARMEAAGGTGSSLESKESLPVGRWCTFEVAADGQEMWIGVDGRVLARQPLHAAIVQQADDRLAICPGEQPVDGDFDEVRLLAYVLDDPLPLPENVHPVKAYRIDFDVLGDPIAPDPIELRIEAEQRTETLQVGQGGVLR